MQNERDHVIDDIPWYLNGTLAAHRHARVEGHLRQCADCSRELAMQQRIRGAIAQPTKIEIAPQASFNKLWDRIGTEESRSNVGTESPLSRVMESWRGGIRWCRRQWMPLMLGAQALIIVALVGVLSLKYVPDVGAYRTVTTVDNEQRPIVHVVFADTVRLSDVKDILGRSGLEVVSGPSRAGVYTLTPENTVPTADIDTLLRVLREDPRVRFAELSHP